MEKMLVFDMDGTIANLYGVPNWLEYLTNEDTTPYEIAEPLYNMETLKFLLLALKTQGYRIAVTSWLSKGGSAEYNKAVRNAKKEWLKKYDFPFDEIHLVKFGTNKSNCTRAKGGYQILVDDNKEVRAKWTLGDTINAKTDILPALVKLLL